MQLATRLPPDLWAGALVVRSEIGEVVKLVGEEAQFVFLGTDPGDVAVLLRVRKGHGAHLFELGAEGLEQIVLFLCLMPSG